MVVNWKEYYTQLNSEEMLGMGINSHICSDISAYDTESFAIMCLKCAGYVFFIFSRNVRTIYISEAYMIVFIHTIWRS